MIIRCLKKGLDTEYIDRLSFYGCRTGNHRKTGERRSQDQE